jgi:hypothetical protein
MPTGPKGEKRPADVIGNAVKVMRIATGEIDDDSTPPSNKRKSGKAGGAKRSENLSAQRRSEIAKRAANSRWAQKTTVNKNT